MTTAVIFLIIIIATAAVGLLLPWLLQLLFYASLIIAWWHLHLPAY